MKKEDLIRSIAEKAELTKKDSAKALEALVETITDALADKKKVQVVGFGSFLVRDRAPRKGRNPQTGDEIVIPATKVPAFKPGKALKEVVK